VVNIARQLKHFGGKSRDGRARNKYVSSNRYRALRKKRSNIDEKDPENIEVLLKNYLANSNEETADKILLSDSAWNAGQLVGPDYDKWVPYSAMLTYSLPNDDGIKDFAYFVYCMLNHQ